jgi:hypothetical protein
VAYPLLISVGFLYRDCSILSSTNIILARSIVGLSIGYADLEGEYRINFIGLLSKSRRIDVNFHCSSYRNSGSLHSESSLYILIRRHSFRTQTCLSCCSFSAGIIVSRRRSSFLEYNCSLRTSLSEMRRQKAGGYGL